MDSRYRNLALFFITAVFFGGTFASIKVGLAVIPPIFFAALRFDIGGVILLAYAFTRIDNWRPRTRRDWRAVIAAASLFIIANNVFLFLGQQYTSSAIAAVMYSFSPILTPVFALFLLENERLSWPGIVGILLGFVGITIIANPDPGNLLTGDVLGMALVLLAAASVALGGVLVRRADPDMSSVGMTAWAMIISAPTIHVLSAVLGESVSIAQWTPKTLLALGYIGVLATAVAYTTYFELLDQVGPIKVSLNTYVVPIVAAVIGWMLLGEPITVTMMGGFAFIFAGFLLLERQTFVDELDRISIAVPGLSAPVQQSDSSSAQTQQHSYDRGSAQSSDTNSCDD
jgi:drug/metabolite transporter (DMT)-like permease